jgi:hypothetical protein
MTNGTRLQDLWTLRATCLQSAILTHTFDTAYGAFRDNATLTTLYPQDANSMALLFGLVSPSSAQAQSISTALTKNWTPIGAETPELPGNISPFISSFEIQSHFTVGNTHRALELIRRSWGWYANHPNGTGGSTVIEGYRTNGTFGYRQERGYGYDPSYVSHAHGWGSGPTSALTEFVVGLKIREPAGKVWVVEPRFGDLEEAEGGFVTGLGKFRVGWVNKKGRERYTVGIETPVGTKGSVRLPLEGMGIYMDVVLTVNGEEIGKEGYTQVDGQLVWDVDGGTYDIQVSRWSDAVGAKRSVDEGGHASAGIRINGGRSWMVSALLGLSVLGAVVRGL